jgi:hypothetical protein
MFGVYLSLLSNRYLQLSPLCFSPSPTMLIFTPLLRRQQKVTEQYRQYDVTSPTFMKVVTVTQP